MLLAMLPALTPVLLLLPLLLAPALLLRLALSLAKALGMLLPFLLIPMAGSIAGVAVWLMIDDTRLEQTGLFLAPLDRTRDIADRVVGDVVETVDEVVERAGRVEDDR